MRSKSPTRSDSLPSGLSTGSTVSIETIASDLLGVRAGETGRQVVVGADSEELGSFPFLFMTGHKLVRFSAEERTGLERFVRAGGFLFSDDCNHDVNGLYAKSFEAEMKLVFPSAPMRRIPNTHPLYHCFFRFPDGPPQTSHELNGWGDNLVHSHLLATTRGDRIAVLYSNKDYSSEWGYHPDNKRFLAIDNTKFGVNIIVYALTR